MRYTFAPFHLPFVKAIMYNDAVNVAVPHASADV
jgi:hypothetical protein